MLHFEGWCRLLLLDAMQRAGFFRAARQTATLQAIVQLNKRSVGSSGHARMVQAALDILLTAGYLRSTHTFDLKFALQIAG